METPFVFDKQTFDPLTQAEVELLYSVKFGKSKGGTVRNKAGRKKRRLYKLQDGLCFYCGLPTILTFGNPPKMLKKNPRIFTLEHINPQVDGGSNRQDNLVGACQHCNNCRGIGNPFLFWWFLRSMKVVTDAAA